MATELLETLIHNNDELNRILQYIINNPLNWKYEENHTSGRLNNIPTPKNLPALHNGATRWALTRLASDYKNVITTADISLCLYNVINEPP